MTAVTTLQAEVRHELVSAGLAPSAEQPEGRPVQFSGTLQLASSELSALCSQLSARTSAAYSSALRNIQSLCVCMCCSCGVLWVCVRQESGLTTCNEGTCRDKHCRSRHLATCAAALAGLSFWVWKEAGGEQPS